MDIRQLRYLIALAREKHFTRAAEACCVTQPTLSGRIKQLEDELGAPIVLRGQRYVGLTPEGERVLRWARRIVEDFEGMRQDLSMLAGEPEGRIVLSVIPSAMPYVAALTERVIARFPRVGFTIFSRTSRQIARELDERAIDAGLTYLDGPTLAGPGGLARPLYIERYRLFLRADHALAGRREVSWTEAAAHPLCALTPDMQNRAIVDAAFAEAGCAPSFAVESNSVIALCGHVETGSFAAVLPEVFLRIFGETGTIRGVPLEAARVEHRVGLLLPDRDPQPALTAALLDAAEGAPDPADWLGAAP